MFSRASKPVRFLYKTVKYTGITAVTGVSLLYFFQSKLLYFPQIPNRIPNQNPPGLRHPGEANLKYEDVYITTPDGLKLHGWFIKNEPSQSHPTIVVFQGRGGNIGHRVTFLSTINKYCTANILIVGYRGFSYSEGTPSEEGLQKDSVAIMDYVFSRDDIDKNKVFVLGTSMGGAVTIYGVTQKTYQLAGVILENTFTSISDMINVKYPFLAKVAPYLLTNHWESIKRVGKIHAPILFISGLSDKLIPPVQMKQLYEAANQCKFKEIIHIEEGTHNETWKLGEAQYFAGLKSFMEKALSDSKTS